jgi:hypothetical protein
MDKFDVSKWKKEMILKEMENNNLDPDLVKSIHTYLTKELHKLAEKHGDRMSHFEERYPTSLSLYYDLEKNLKPSLKEQNSTDDITSVHISYQDSHPFEFYGFYIYKNNHDDWDEKLYTVEDVNKFLNEKGVNSKIPYEFNPSKLKQVKEELQQKGIKASYDADMNVD